HIREHEEHEMMRQFQVICRADVAPPYGVVDTFVVIESLGLLSAGSPDADWNGDTVIDIFDVLAFLGDFEGC
ncbi:MAG: hypothetical protein KDA28_02050, partial [Phycisphaerales bacterium]|nr:hypothetical protein [Phycisphaerales bacterium]